MTENHTREQCVDVLSSLFLVDKRSDQDRIQTHIDSRRHVENRRSRVVEILDPKASNRLG